MIDIKPIPQLLLRRQWPINLFRMRHSTGWGVTPPAGDGAATKAAILLKSL
jgi:hypothetical protein